MKRLIPFGLAVNTATDGGLSSGFFPRRSGLEHGLLVAACLAMGRGPLTSQTAADFAGHWVNVYPETRSITRLVLIESNGGTELIVHGFGACSPECDWGEIRVPFTGNPLLGVFDFGFKTTTLTICLPTPGFLFVHADNYFIDGRDYVHDHLFHRDADPPLAGGDASGFAGDWLSLYPEDKDFDSGNITTRILRAKIKGVAGSLEIGVHAVCQPQDCPIADGRGTVAGAGNPFTADLDFRSEEGVSWGAFPFTFRLFDGDLLHITGLFAESVLHRAESPGICYVPARPSFHRGDPDGNGTINISDPIFLLSSLFHGGAQPGCRESADADNDGKIDITDAIYLLNGLFLGGPQPAAPGPTGVPCGLDPDAPGSPGNLGCEAYTGCE